ncbi:nucleotidyltransferase domain-containing protein [Accumulibacter sp.]|uniref:nucleotidyltransferase domain-containing protein n=1 Tax=Accumulibacter sp. TaxID=2053492 RepID=UPI0034247D4D
MGRTVNGNLDEYRSPARVILFGSYARGTADDDSDLDLMVIEREVPDKAAEHIRLTPLAMTKKPSR